MTIDMTNQRYNKLTVIKFDHYDKKYNSYWLCKCDCGNYKIVRRSHLLSGGVQSCGCVLLEGRGTYKNGWRTHGLWHNNQRLCKIWDCMKDRCYNKNNKKYKYYGKRGIEVCEEWKENFSAFLDWALSNGYDKALTIDRIDNNKGYYPENCRWITIEKQQNNKRNNVKIDYKDKSQTIAEWSRETGINSSCLGSRYRRGLVGSELFYPIKGYSKNRTFLTYNGETKSITAWSKLLRIHLDRLKRLLQTETFSSICDRLLNKYGN